MKVLVKPIKNEEYSLVEGYCEFGVCNPLSGSCGLGPCNTVSGSEDQVNLDNEILF